MTTSRFGSFLATITLAACAGCGGATDQPDLGEVEGTVTVNGTPLANATVEFRPQGEDGGRPSIGTTEADGTYELQYTVDAMGAKVGEHTVMVRLNEDEEDYEEEEGDDDEAADSGLPAAASDGSLKKTVKAGSNTINIEL